MRGLVESIFDKDLVEKDITLGQYFEISIDRHMNGKPRSNNDKKAMSEMEKYLNSLSLKSLDCEKLIKTLSELSKKYTKNWNGGGYSYKVYDKNNHSLNFNQIKTADLFHNVSKMSLGMEDWDDNYDKFYTYFVFTRK